ncbi:MAG TPA: nucleotidyltransferase domain-containing protein [Blastocatellia bacterium]|nr:nucleotidyltransferase domain-containing protein [Blastocatellia bacterium]
MELDQRVHDEISEHPYPLLFATVSGAHLYGFPSADSDVDMRGVHILPARDAVGLWQGRETVEVSHVREGLEIDLVTHDAKKFFLLLLKKNGYVLEQLYSPLVIVSTREHDELRSIARGCVTRNHSHHYIGFATTEWRLFEKDRRVKPLLYIFRVLLTGIYLMRTGEIEANLRLLNLQFKLSYIDDLIVRKVEGAECELLGECDIEFYRKEYERLIRDLNEAHSASKLPEGPSCKAELNDLLVRLRLRDCQ